MGRGLAVVPDKIKEFYYGLDAYVGIGTEGFGLPALEAASTGIPNIALDYGASREILGNSALYIPAVSTQLTILGRIGIASIKDLTLAMQTLIDDENECKKLGKNGIARAKNFPWDKPLKRLDQIFEEELDARTK
jgi:glycosyltransferase involved in cell wall biosynthesis